jgi:hypothetical protein
MIFFALSRLLLKLSTSRIASRRPLLSCRQVSNNSCELPPQFFSASVDSKRHRGKTSEIARAAPGEYLQHHPHRFGKQATKTIRRAVAATSGA